VELKALLDGVVLECVIDILGHAFEFDFQSPIGCAFEEPYTPLAYGEDEEFHVTPDYRQQRPQVKPVAHNYQFTEAIGKAVIPEEVGREKKGKSFALVPPEGYVARDLLNRRHEVLHFGRAQVACKELFLTFADEISEAYLILLLTLRSFPYRGHIKGKAKADLLVHEGFQGFSGNDIHSVKPPFMYMDGCG
jgi:hypothetical protein